MRFFRLESKEEKELKKKQEAEEREKELLLTYGMTRIDPADKDLILGIINTLESNLNQTPDVPGLSTEEINSNFLSAIVQQNWIMIRQLDRLNKHMPLSGETLSAKQ